ncbi:GPI transamidase component PIG-S-like [Ruditapes philippinarum]|uniref:GPI transamidase component PIG-S-like n=1 Tax=Ruditapes philippinarum TaxID=129788 RepID=UPI00295B08D0|nr:GPI transamidase component PIG-S-like [Ruditapes philippinarum]
MADTDQETAEKRTNVQAAIGVGFVCLVVGLPLWWKTTEVYRVSLPYSDIDTLADTKIKYTVDLNVISFLEKVSETDLASLSRLVSEELEDKKPQEVTSHYRTFTREASSKEQQIFKSASSLQEIDLKLSQEYPGKANEYSVILLAAKNYPDVKKPTLGSHRFVYIPVTATDMAVIAEYVAETVKTALVRETTILKLFDTARGARDRKPDKEMLRSVRFHSGYDVTLTLVNPRPDILDVSWDIESAVNAYLDPFVKSMSNYTDINIKSQVLYFTKLQTKPKKENKEYIFTSKDLPHMINPLEAKLGSPASTNPELNFLVYVPSKDQYPLYIKGDDGQKLASNSFLSPQWGGIHIYNVAQPQEGVTLPVKSSLDMAQVMRVILSQLRLLLNLHSQLGGTEFLPIGKNAVTDWELDSWLRSRCVENLATSSATLKSLAQLLGKISNIVINDDIGNEVHKAVASMHESLQLLSDGYLVEAYQHSKSAILASEKAFFDPSLLELLYFPEDQKFAIYIPLFLPISFPVLASLWQSYKWYKGLSKPKQE